MIVVPAIKTVNLSSSYLVWHQTKNRSYKAKEQSKPGDQMSRSEVGAVAMERTEQRIFRREREDWSSVTISQVTRDVVIT